MAVLLVELTPRGGNCHFYANYVSEFSFVLSTNMAAMQTIYNITNCTQISNASIFCLLQALQLGTCQKNKPLCSLNVLLIERDFHSNHLIFKNLNSLRAHRINESARDLTNQMITRLLKTGSLYNAIPGF